MYHEGFRVQAHSWQKNPVHLALQWLQGKPSGWTVADFGCGDALLAQELSGTHTVHSFDLYAHNEWVTACNMASIPCKDGASGPSRCMFLAQQHTQDRFALCDMCAGSCEAAVFSLALMGTDYGKFLEEAYRVVKPGGYLWIAEVKSRFVPDGADKEAFSPFLERLQELGFKVLKQNAGNKMFVVWVCKKMRDTVEGKKTVKWPVLKPCIYKRR